MMHSRHSLTLSSQVAANGDGSCGRRLSSPSQATFVRVTCPQVKRAAAGIAVGETAGVFIRIKITLDGKRERQRGKSGERDRGRETRAHPSRAKSPAEFRQAETRWCL